MKKLLLRLPLFLPTFAVLIGVNYFVDPGNLFSNGSMERGIAESLLNGKNVTNVINYDERALQKYYIEKSLICPDIIAIGSSRLFQMREDMFNDSVCFFNNSVNNASINDFLAISELYFKKGAHPRKVILGIEPRMFNENFQNVKWMTLKDEYFEMIAKLSCEAGNYTFFNPKWAEIISLSYFQEALPLIKKLKKIKSCYPTDSLRNESYTKLKDGSLTYGVEMLNVSPIEVERQALKYVNSKHPDDILSLKFDEFDSNKKRIFENYVGYLKNLGIEVVFFLPPYHPIVYNSFQKNKDYKSVSETEDYLIQFAKENNIRVFGTYNPLRYGNLAYDFFDQYHPKETLVKAILSEK